MAVGRSAGLEKRGEPRGAHAACGTEEIRGVCEQGPLSASKSTPGPHTPGAGAGPQTQASGTWGSLRKDLAVTSGGRTVPPRTDLRSLAENVLGGGPSRRVGVVGNWVTQIPGNPEVMWLTR